MSYLLIYLYLSLFMSYLLLKAFKNFFESHNDILKSPYPTLETIVTFIVFYVVWPVILIIHLYQFFDRWILVSLNVEFNLSKWVLIPKLSNDSSFFKPTDRERIYKFLFITVTYCYNKKDKS